MASTIQKAVAQHKAELLKGSNKASAEMVRLYREVYATFKQNLTSLDSDANINIVLRKERLENILKQTEAELQRFATSADKIITKRQQTAITLGQAHTADLAKKTAQKATQAATWRKLPTSALEDLVGATRDGTPVGKVLQKLIPSGVDKVRDALITGVATGKTPEMIAREVRDELGGNLGRFLTVARTEEVRAYRSSSIRSMQKNDHIIQGWTWSASLSDSSCFACIEQHGSIHPLNEEMDSHPNCRCVPVPYAGDEVETGTSWFLDQDEEVQRTILGDARYSLYRDNKITLSDLTTTNHSRTWGNSRTVRPIKDL